MKIKKMIVLVLFVVFISGLWASNSGLGVGVIIGEPTGISLKQWTGSTTAFDGAIAWSFSGEEAIHLHADFLKHNTSIFSAELPVYYGLGAKLKLADDAQLGVRIPLGIAYEIKSSPLDLFLEVVPGLKLIPDTDFGFDAAIGMRYYF